jgi:hypothetical protein
VAETDGKNSTAYWVSTPIQEAIRSGVTTPGVTLVVGAWGTGKTALANKITSDNRRGRIVLEAPEHDRDLDEVERRVQTELGLGRSGDLVILDALNELRSAPDLNRLMRFVQAPWLGQAHIFILSQVQPAGVDTAFREAERASLGSRSYRIFDLTWSLAQLTGVLWDSGIDRTAADALLALLRSSSPNPAVSRALLAAAQAQLSGDRSGTPDLLVVPDRSGRLRVLPSTGLGMAELELVPGRTLTATPRIMYRATRAFWLPEAAQLEELINEPGISEQDLQSFFEENPHLLAGTSYDRVVPHPVLSRDQDGPLIPDFMLEPMDGGFADVLDLKLPHTQVVAGGMNRVRQSAHVTEALAQVREYRAYFEDIGHRQAVLDRYGLRAYRPMVAIVIGRDPGPDRDPFQIKRLWDELPRHVRLMTFDDLLRQVRRMGLF